IAKAQIYRYAPCTMHFACIALPSNIEWIPHFFVYTLFSMRFPNEETIEEFGRTTYDYFEEGTIS
ncbi:hypothetical protein JW960_19825, partial [candidate division KSB1 bacterium]|nr:hypothetical protein [candidate division KSB1 bacterium]